MLGIRNSLRPMIRVETLVLIVVAWLVATANGAWWSAVGEGRDWSQSVQLAVHGQLLRAAGRAAFRDDRAVRDPLDRAPTADACWCSPRRRAAYFMRTFAVMLDPTMIQNVLRTDPHEARELHQPGHWWPGCCSGRRCRSPSSGWCACSAEPPLRALLVRAGSVLGAPASSRRLALLTISRDLTSFMRNQHEARYLITPGNILVGLVRNSAHRVQDVERARARRWAATRISRSACGHRWRPRVLVLVVGETARAANFSLFGYPARHQSRARRRPTSPRSAT